MTARRTLTAGLLTAVVLAAYLLTGGDSPYRIRVAMDDAAGLRTGSVVELGGVPVGTVTDLEVTARDDAIATLELDGDDSVRIGPGASVRVRPANLLGEKVVDLRPGARDRPLPSGATIPRSRVAVTVELDQVLDTLDATTRSRLGILLHEAGTAFLGRGTDVAATLRTLAPAAEDTAELIEQATADNRRLDRLLTRTQTTLATLVPRRRELGELIDTAARATAATAARADRLGESVDAAPALLRQAQETLRRLDRTGAALRPAARGLRVTAPALTDAMRALPGFTRAATPALAEARAAAPALTRLGRRTAPVVRRLRPAARSLEATATAADDLTGAVDRGSADLLGLLENWARAIQPRDGLSHQFRVSVSYSEDIIKALIPYVRDRLATRRRPSRTRPGGPAHRKPALPGPVRPHGERPRKLVPDLPVLEGPSLDKVDETVGGLLDFLLEP